MQHTIIKYREYSHPTILFILFTVYELASLRIFQHNVIDYMTTTRALIKVRLRKQQLREPLTETKDKRNTRKV